MQFSIERPSPHDYLTVTKERLEKKIKKNNNI